MVVTAVGTAVVAGTMPIRLVAKPPAVAASVMGIGTVTVTAVTAATVATVVTAAATGAATAMALATCRRASAGALALGRAPAR